MLLIDRRTGSGELKKFFEGMLQKGEVELDDLPFGDFAFEGNGPDGTCMVGVERKTVRDMLGCIRTGRFSGYQLQGMAGEVPMYQFCYLIVEGIIRPAKDGILESPTLHGWKPVEIGSQRFMYKELDKFLATIERKTPVTIRRSSSKMETAVQIVDLYRWFNEKEWSEHRSHWSSYHGSAVVLRKPSLVRRWASELYGIDWRMSANVAKRFATPRIMANATEGEWREVDGIGIVKAARIHREITEEEKP